MLLKSIIASLCLPILLMVSSNAQAQAQAQAQVQAQAPEPESTVIAVNEDDRKIDERLEAILQQIDGMANVRVRVSAGVVSLTGEVPEITQIQQAEEIAARLEGVITVRNSITQVDNVAEQIQPAMERMLERIQSIAFKLPILLVATLAFGLVAAFGFWLAASQRLWQHLAPNAFIADIFKQIVRLFFIAMGIVLALDILGATALLSTLVGAAGIVGLAVGFAVRDTVENYIASILLSLRQPFKPNDYVEIAGQEGTIISLTSRATILMSADGNHVRIPNATVFKGTITNYTSNPDRRFNFIISIAPDANADIAIKLGIEALEAARFTEQDLPSGGWIDSVGASTIDIFFCGWIDQTKHDFARSKSAAIQLVLAALNHAEIDMPEPTYRLIMHDAKEKTMAAKRKIATVDAIHTEADTTMVDHLEDERQKGKTENYLDPKAPQEM